MTKHASVQGKPRTMFYERGKPNPVNYVNNCASRKNWQKHHILPCTSVRKSIAAASNSNPLLDKAIKYFTVWNINDAGNLMSMPTRKAFQVAYGMVGGKQGAVPKLSDLPCHQPVSWGHTVYNDRADKKLIDVWANVTVKVEKHKLEANDVSSDIDAIKDDFKSKLESGRDGSIDNWRAMMKGEGNAHHNFTMVKLPISPV